VLFPGFRKPGTVMSAYGRSTRCWERHGLRWTVFLRMASAQTATNGCSACLSYTPRTGLNLNSPTRSGRKIRRARPTTHTKYNRIGKIIMQDWADILDAMARGDR